MKVLVVVSAVLAVAAAQFLPYSGWAGYAGYPYAAGWWNGAAPYYSAYSAPAATPLTYNAYTAFPYAHHTAYAAPAVASSQYHSQNEFGGYNYGYADGLSTKHESKNALGGTVGSYSYLDANNKIQTVNYVADAAGFRVTGTNLPVAPKADLQAPVHSLVGPAPVEDTAEVKAAKAEFRKLYDEAAAAAEAAPDSRKKRSLEAPLPVEDTAEVKAARAEHARLFAEAAAAAEAAPDTDGPEYDPAADLYAAYPYPYSSYPYTYAAAPYTYAAAPLTYSAVRPAAGFSYGFNSAHYPYAGFPYARYFY